MNFKIKKLNWKLFFPIILPLLIYWFLDVQKEYYLHSDIFSFGFKENLILIAIIFFLTLLYFYRFNDDEKDSFIRIAKTFTYSVFLSLYVFFIIQKTIITGSLFVNKLFSKELLIERFEVNSIYKNGEVEIQSLKDDNLVVVKNKFTEKYLSIISEGDTIDIIFVKGVLGKKYLKNKTIVIKNL